MYRESQEKRSSRSRSRDRRAIGDPHLGAVGRAQREGNVQLKKQANASRLAWDFIPGNRVPVEENSFDLEFRCASPKKVSRRPLKAPIDKKISKEMEIRHSSPSLVARLMGLETLPPVVTKQRIERGINSETTSSVGLHKKHIIHEAYSLQTSSNEYQECKDVFEVTEIPKTEKQDNEPFQRGIPSSEQSEIDFKPSTNDLAFAKQKFMDVAHLSTDDEFQYKEYHDALEDLDPSKGRFVKYLQEPSSLFQKHLQDLKGSPPSPHASHITILKPSKVAKSDNELCCRSERNSERHPFFVKGEISSSRGPVSDLAGRSVKESSSSLPHKLSGKIKSHLQPTQIVVLKPSLEKTCDMETTVPLARSLESYLYGLKREKRNPMSKRSEVYAGRRDRHTLSDNVDIVGHKTKGLREIARDITKQLKTAGNNGSNMVAASKKYGHIRDETSCGISDMETFNLESRRWTCDQLNDCNDSISTTSSYSTKSSVNWEARKCLSDRWKMIQQIQGLGAIDKGSSTLGEMLVYDRETPKATLDTSIVRNISGEKVAKGEVLARWDCPLGIRGNDGWKEGWSRNLSRSKSVPASSLVYENRKPSKRNKVSICDNSYLQNLLNRSPYDSLATNVSQRRKSSVPTFKYCQDNAQFCSSREETEMFEREIHVNSVELHGTIHARHHSDVVGMVPGLSRTSVAGRDHDNVAFQFEDTKFPLTDPNNLKMQSDQQVQQSTKLTVPVNDLEFSGTDPNDLTRKEMLADHPQVKSISSHCGILRSLSPLSSKEDQPSPVSVLELSPSEEDKSSSECFEKISADLKELRMQLKLLKLESADTDTEDLELLISSDEDPEECRSHLNSGEILEVFRDDEDRDFSYLLDVLIHSGVHRTSANGLFNTCHTLEYPVGREVFERLEKKYNVLVSWPRSERTLLFDLISSILADIFNPSIDLQSMRSRRSHPTLAREGLIEEVWQLVVKQRDGQNGKLEEKLLLEPRWLNLGEDVDMVGRELERMLIEELTEELLSQLI